MSKGVNFDEISFLDLPTLEEREEILAVHLRKRNRLLQDHEIARLAQESEGYVGGEIEQAVDDGLYVGFNEGREFTTADISAALDRQVHPSRHHRRYLDQRRRAAAATTVPAGPAATRTTGDLAIDPGVHRLCMGGDPTYARRQGRTCLRGCAHCRALRHLSTSGPQRWEDERFLCSSANPTVHLLTDRYTMADLRSVPPTEVILTAEGEVLLSGTDPLHW